MDLYITPKDLVTAAFTWSNDDDNNTANTATTGCGVGKCKVDSVTCYEVSGAFRSGGIYSNSETELNNRSVEGGYMVIPSKLEIVAGYSSRDADNYANEWTRTSIRANYFFRKHDVKVQLTWQMNEDMNGIAGNDEVELLLQMQYVFQPEAGHCHG